MLKHLIMSNLSIRNFPNIELILQLKTHNNNLHADCHKRHGFCEEKEPQKSRPLWQPVKLALAAINLVHSTELK